MAYPCNPIAYMSKTYNKNQANHSNKAKLPRQEKIKNNQRLS